MGPGKVSKLVRSVVTPSDNERWVHSIARALVELKQAPSGCLDRRNAKHEGPVENDLAEVGTSPGSIVSPEP